MSQAALGKLEPARSWVWSLATASACSGGMAVYHYFLPYQFGWLDDVKPGARMVAWGMIMVNDCFSTLLLISAVLTLVCARKWSNRDTLTIWFIAGCAVFWVLNFFRQVLVPMPLSARLHGLSWILPAFAAVVAGLYLVALNQLRNPRPQ